MEGTPNPTASAVLRSLVMPIYLPALATETGTAMLLPILPLYLRSIELSYSRIAWILAAAGLGAMLAQLPFGQLLGRRPEQSVMAGAVAVMATSVAALGWIELTALLLAARLAWGAGSTGWLLSRQTLMTRATTSSVRGRAMSLFGGTTRLGYFLGPVIGGFTVEAVGYRLGFLAAGAVTALGVLPLLVARRPSTRSTTRLATTPPGPTPSSASIGHQASTPPPSLSPSAPAAASTTEVPTPAAPPAPAAASTTAAPRPAVPEATVAPSTTVDISSAAPVRAVPSTAETVAEHWRMLLPMGVAQVLVIAARQGRQIVIPLIGEGLGLDPGDIGLLVGIGTFTDFLLFPIAGYVMDRFGRLAAVVPAFTLVGIGLMWLATVDSYAGVAGAAALIGVGNSFGSGTMLTVSSDIAPAHATSQFLGTLGAIRDLGKIVGPIAVGVLADVFGLGVASAALGAGAFSAVMIFVFFVGETSHHSTRPAGR